MLRSTLIAAGAVLLGSASYAQQLDRSNIFPLTQPAKNAGVYNLATNRWMKPSREVQFRAASLTVYNNTCTWTGGGFYTGTGDCEDYIDDGRIPGGAGDPNAPVGATTDNQINFFEISYCTNEAPGTVSINVSFYDTLGGGCVSGVAPQPPLLTQHPNLAAYYALPPAALPGDVAPGGTGVTCWTVGFNVGNGGFCLQSDGEGIWDNVDALDQFNWVWQFNNPSVAGLAPNGVVLSGEPNHPSSGGPGSCTYNIPCGTDFLYGNPCGTGLLNDDQFWVNVDGDIPGNGTNTGVPCVSAPSQGTTCYFFGGYPGNPQSGFWMVLGSAGACGGCSGSPINYCTAGTTTNGCNATIALSSGIPSVSNAGPATITVSGVEGNKQGLIFYGLAQNNQQWGIGGNSFLCVKAPLQRTASMNGGGTTGLCDGVLSTDLNAAIALNGGTIVTVPVFAGMVVDVQGWFRDPQAVKTTSLSNGLEVTLCP